MSDDIENKLNELRDELDATGEDIDKKSKERETLKIDINFMQKIGNDIDQISSTYDKEYDNIEKDNEWLIEYANGELKILLDNIPENQKEKVENIIKNINDVISKKKQDCEKSYKAYKIAKTSYDVANNNVEIYQNSIDSLKRYQKDIDETLRNLKNLKDLIQKAEVGKNLEVYFWSKEFNSKVNFELKTKESFKKDLVEAWNDLNEAKTKFRKAEKAERSAKIEFDKIHNEFDKLSGNLNQDILDKIKKEEGH